VKIDTARLLRPSRSDLPVPKVAQMDSTQENQLSGPADPRRPLLARKHPLSTEVAADRTTAYVYGNILVLAAMVALVLADAATSHAVLIVMGTAISTFVAHVFAEAMGGLVRHTEPPTIGSALAAGRESFPILTSGVLPSVILLLGLWDLVATGLALTLAEGIVLFRIASTGVVVARLRNERSSLKIILIGVGAAVVGGLISLLKVYLTH
jgi:uncharacterized membrane protein